MHHIDQRITANVDEVFIDLCRQMLRKEDEQGHGDEDEDTYKYDSMGASNKRRRRRRLRDSNQRCVVL